MHDGTPTPEAPARTESRPRRRRRALPAAAVCAALVIAAVCAATALADGGHAARGHVARAPVAHAASGKTVNISLAGFMFSPMKVTIKSGTTVVWHWPFSSGGPSERVTHTITSLARKGALRFRSNSGKSQGTYSVKFTKPGKYFYECAIHPLTMQGEIIVTK